MQDRDRDLQALLQELRAEGRADSTGRFSLDPEHALEKLRRYRLQEHHHYVLPVLSAAVLAGAVRFTASTDADDTVLEFDGDPFAPEELRDLLSHLLTGNARPAVLELAAGVHGATGLEPLRVGVESWGPRGGGRLVLEGRRTRFEEMPGQAPPPATDGRPRESGLPVPRGITRVHVRDRLRWQTVRRWMSRRLALTPEAALLAERGALAPLALQVDGRAVSHPFDPDPCLACRRLKGPGGLLLAHSKAPIQEMVEAPFDGLLAAEANPGQTLVLRRGSQAPGEPWDWGARRGELTLVVRGVSYPPPEPWEWPLVRAVASSPRLSLDLSRSRVVADQEWRALAETLQGQALEMALSVARQREALSVAQQVAAVPLVDRARQNLPADHPDQEPLLDHLVGALEQSLAPDSLPIERARLDLARHLRLRGREEEARTHFLHALETHRLRERRTRQAGPLAPGFRQLAEERVSLEGEVHGPETLPVAEALEELGDVAGLLGDDALSATSWQRALEIRSRRQPPDHLDRAACQDGAALAERRAGRLDKGAALHREALGIRSRHPEHPDLVRGLAFQAQLLLAAGQAPEAAHRLAEAADLQRQATGAGSLPLRPLLDGLAEAALLAWNQEERGEGAWSLAEAVQRCGDATAARGWRYEAVGWRHRPRPEEHLLLAVLDHLATHLRKHRPDLDPRGDQVRDLAIQVWALGQATTREEHYLMMPPASGSIGAYGTTAMEYLHQGALDLALRTYRRALALAESQHGLASDIYRALGWRVVHLLRRLRRWGEADPLVARLELLAAWSRGD